MFWLASVGKHTLSDVTAQLDRCIKEFNIAYEQHKVHQAGTLLTNLKIVNKFNVGDRIYGMTVDSVREREREIGCKEMGSNT